ncbi:MAG: aminotransferase class I/II-fold pyridoxal phosphate-dependent enzyme [Gemmatimonadaceae bacterium]|nr:aminotransferase class I/II-fold pyridoxal phosphate-dependent enzyme [Gemmatimonadaceae bacterium]
MIDTTLNPHVIGRGASPTLAINERTKALAARGRDVYRLGFGQSPFPVPARVVESLRANAAAKDYDPSRGLPELRDAVAGWFRRRGVEAHADNVVIGPGSKELIFLVQLARNSELLLPSPSWVSYAPQAGVLGLPVTWIPTDMEGRWSPTPEALAHACATPPTRPRLLLLNSPSNPTGVSLRGPQLAALAEVARQHRVLVLSDEIYGELDHAGAHVSMASHYPEGTIVTGGLSKWCGAGGWRLGTALFPPGLRWLQEAVVGLASETYSTAAAPIQRAAITAYAGGDDLDLYVVRSRRIMAALGQAVTRRLTDARVHVASPDGGFYLFPEFGHYREAFAQRDITTGSELCERLLEDTGVALLPGAPFGRPVAELSARLSYVDFDGAAALDAVASSAEGPVDDAFLQRHCGRVLEGATRIGAWLRG